MGRGLQALRSDRSIFARTYRALVLLQTKADREKRGLSCVGRAESLTTPPTPHQAELESWQGTCRGVWRALAGAPEGQGRPAGPEALGGGCGGHLWGR